VDGWRIFPTEFNRRIVERLAPGAKTLAEISREFDIQPSVIREWTHRGGEQ
jgi:transposase-like protein